MSSSLTLSRQLFEIGKQAFEDEEYEKALEIFETVEAKNLVEVDRSELSYQLGSTLYFLSRYEEAIPYLKARFESLVNESIEQQKSCSLLRVCVRYAQCHMKTGSYTKAGEILESCLDVLESFSEDFWAVARYDYHILRGRVFLFKGSGEKALRLIKLASKEIPHMISDELKQKQSAHLAFERGSTHLHMNNPRRAAFYFSRVKDELLDPLVKADFIAYWIAAESFKENFVKVLVLYKRYEFSVEGNRFSDKIFYEVGRAHYHLGNVEHSREFLERALSMNPKDEKLIVNVNNYLNGLLRFRPSPPEKNPKWPKTGGSSPR